MKIIIELAGISIAIELRYADALLNFAPYRTDRKAVIPAAVAPEEIDLARTWYEPGSSEAYIEYMELSLKISDALLPFNRVIFHGTAFVWRQKAWIFAAVSGTGKTTQYLRWKERFGEEVQILNGDKPVLAVTDEEIVVYPSPWNGKEGMGQQITAPLGGIILLRQSQENRIRKISARESAGILFPQFLFNRNITDDVYKVGQLEESMLNRTPVWLLENRGDTASAVLCHDTLMEEKL